MRKPPLYKILILLVTMLLVSGKEALALPVNFIYPYTGQVVAPGDRMFIRWAEDSDLKSVTPSIDFTLVPTMKPSGVGEDISMGRESSAINSFYFSVPGDILIRSQGVTTFQVTAKISNGTIYYSDVFRIVKGVATSSVDVDRSKSLFNPKCGIDKDTIPPNGTVIFTPTPPYQGIPDFAYTQFGYRWIGETSLKSSGAVALSFIYPGVYTVVLEADPHNGAIYQIECPEVKVSSYATGATNLGGVYLFPFNAPATKPLIPKESSEMGTGVVKPGCLNLAMNLSYGYSDATTIKKNGVIYALQEFLVSRSYLDVSPTGYFGAKTKLAVQSFQRDNDIEPTGFVGLITRGRIKTLSCLK